MRWHSMPVKSSRDEKQRETTRRVDHGCSMLCVETVLVGIGLVLGGYVAVTFCNQSTEDV